MGFPTIEQTVRKRPRATGRITRIRWAPLMATTMACILAIACATGPVSRHCSISDGEGAEPLSQHRTTHFSVISPGGPGWCVSTVEKDKVGFSKFAAAGEKLEDAPPLEVSSHMFGVLAVAQRPPGPDLTTVADLLRFVEWEAQTLEQQSGRFLDKSHSQWEESYRGAVCVRHKSFYEERDPPGVGQEDVVFVHDLEGLTCIHPGEVGLLVRMSFSERWLKGKKYRPGLRELMRGEADASFDSLEFIE